jgi:hypothetical protein
LDEGGNVIGVATLIREEGQNLNFAIAVEKVSEALASSTPYVLPENRQAPQPHQQAKIAERFDNQYGNELEQVYRQLRAHLPERQREWLRLEELRWTKKHEKVRGDHKYVEMTYERLQELKQILDSPYPVMAFQT